MSEILTENISKLLEKERSRAVVLEKSLEKLKEQLSLCKGAIIAYEQLLNGSSSIDEELEKELNLDENVLNNRVFFGDGNKNDENASDLTNSGKVVYKSKGKKKRAARATKAEMSQRKKVVALILKDKGDLTPKDLNPMVDEALGKPLEAHHLRAVLRRFDDIFETKKEHGLWGLTEQGYRFCEQFLDEDEDTSEENSSNER